MVITIDEDIKSMMVSTLSLRVDDGMVLEGFGKCENLYLYGSYIWIESRVKIYATNSWHLFPKQY